MDRTQAALKECGLPGGYWWDAMRHCIGIMNRSPHANVSRTPFESSQESFRASRG